MTASSMSCQVCGSPVQYGGRYYTVITRCCAVCPCRCGRAEGGVAALRLYHFAASYREWGRFGDDLAWEAEDQEEVERGPEEEEGYSVFCPDCVDASRGEGWDVDVRDVGEDRSGEQAFRYCPGCGQETVLA
jgi:hypothetical protein